MRCCRGRARKIRFLVSVLAGLVATGGSALPADAGMVTGATVYQPGAVTSGSFVIYDEAAPVKYWNTRSLRFPGLTQTTALDMVLHVAASPPSHPADELLHLYYTIANQTAGSDIWGGFEIVLGVGHGEYFQPYMIEELEIVDRASGNWVTGSTHFPHSEAIPNGLRYSGAEVWPVSSVGFVKSITGGINLDLPDPVSGEPSYDVTLRFVPFVVPEPTSAALLLIGGVAVLARRRAAA